MVSSSLCLRNLAAYISHHEIRISIHKVQLLSTMKRAVDPQAYRFSICPSVETSSRCRWLVSILLLKLQPNQPQGMALRRPEQHRCSGDPPGLQSSGVWRCSQAEDWRSLDPGSALAAMRVSPCAASPYPSPLPRPCRLQPSPAQLVESSSSDRSTRPKPRRPSAASPSSICSAH